MPSYFDEHPDFAHDPSKPLRKEFTRLARQLRWDPKSDDYRHEWARCCTIEFGHHYGTKDTLPGWQALCVEVGVEDVPNTVAECKKILNQTYVNLVDLVDARRTGIKVETYPTQEALRAYSIRHSKIFPKEEAKSNGFLAALLIEMFNLGGGRGRRRTIAAD